MQEAINIMGCHAQGPIPWFDNGAFQLRALPGWNDGVNEGSIVRYVFGHEEGAGCWWSHPIAFF